MSPILRCLESCSTKKMLVYWTQSTNSRFLPGWQRLFLLGRCYYCIMTITYSSDPINQTIKEEIQLDWYHPLNSVTEELTTELPKGKAAYDMFFCTRVSPTSTRSGVVQTCSISPNPLAISPDSP